MNNKYYIPKIEEFVEGFKYQVKHTSSLMILNCSNPEKSIKSEMKDYWVDRVVPNLDPVEYPYTYIDDEDISWTFMNEPFPEEDPLRMIKIMLENGQIRAKK